MTPSVDNNEFVDLLNSDLATEFQSMVQYIQHIAVVTGAEYMNTVAELRTHLTQELQHATTLAEHSRNVQKYQVEYFRKQRAAATARPTSASRATPRSSRASAR